MAVSRKFTDAISRFEIQCPHSEVKRSMRVLLFDFRILSRPVRNSIPLPLWPCQISSCKGCRDCLKSGKT
jgi:hypothetical protein